jgi:hypothetical protein
MVSVTKAQINTLIELQNIDLETTRIRLFLGNIPPRINQLEARLNEFEQAIIEKEFIISELKKEYRSLESDTQMNQDRIRKNNERLVSVKTNKEYHAILKENEELNRKNSGVEDEMLKKLDFLDEEEKSVLESRSELEKMKSQAIEERESLNKEEEKEKKKLDSLLSSWEEISSKVDLEVMKRFNLAKGQTNGNGVAAVVESVCQGCNMNIPPQMYNELQRCNSLELCPWCHRIIYWQESK